MLDDREVVRVDKRHDERHDGIPSVVFGVGEYDELSLSQSGLYGWRK